jgi:hypothetical protein
MNAERSSEGRGTMTNRYRLQRDITEERAAEIRRATAFVRHKKEAKKSRRIFFYGMTTFGAAVVIVIVSRVMGWL